MTAATLAAGDSKDDSEVCARPCFILPGQADQYHVTVAAVVYDTEELAHSAFGKLNPNQYGVLPILVIIQNDTDQALRLEHLQTEYTSADGQHCGGNAARTKYKPWVAPTGRMCQLRRPCPIHRKHKNPLNVWEIDGRAFSAKLLPAHDSAYGFFYFQTTHQPGSHDSI